jgi:hypothetical protein
MLNFLKQVGNYAREAVQSVTYIIGQGLAAIFDHMQRRPITVQYLISDCITKTIHDKQCTKFVSE